MELIEIIARLRGPDGCPWDKEQTAKSLTPFIIEEAFELTDAIENGNSQEIKDELGDYLFQVVLQAQVASDRGQFSFTEVVESLNEKLIRRHPHVFSAVDKDPKKDLDQIWREWQSIKAKEQESSSGHEIPKKKKFFNYPKNLPALMVASKIGRKTQTYGFDWASPEQVIKKVQEELDEATEALANLRAQKIPTTPEPLESAQEGRDLQEELGDLLFSVAQLARHCGMDAEACLRQGNEKFTRRFEHMLLKCDSSVEAFSRLAPEQKEALWEEAKKL